MVRIKQFFRLFTLLWVVVGTMAYPTTSAVFAQEPREVMIEVGDPSESDDYLCWSPMQARVRLVTPESNAVAVTLSNASLAEGGEVGFQINTGIRPTTTTFLPTTDINLTLPGDGSWVTFWVGGVRPSNGSKDVNLVATDDAGNEVGTLPVMVRVRKDAETLSRIEIDQFLAALATIHNVENGGVDSQLNKYIVAHLQAFNLGIHGSSLGTPLFLAWHRAFLLNLERELQAVDPRVTLPYWRFDQPAPQLFTHEFLGSVAEDPTTPGSHLVEFSPTNPLYGWRLDDGGGALVRGRNGSAIPAYPDEVLIQILSNPFNILYGRLNGDIELNYHNGAHSFIGGWLGQRDSPRDPLFFLLHANVDRAWAHWQAQVLNRFDPASNAGYSIPPNTYQQALGGAILFRRGSYALDPMWPWSNIGGNQGTPDPFDDWPGFAYPMPAAPGAAGPILPPTPASMVDYLNATGRGLAHGTCYDDIDFSGRVIDAGN